MSAPRLEIDLTKIRHNARTLVTRLSEQGISVTGVTKAMLGSPELAAVLLEAGVAALGDSRVENIETLRRAGVTGPITLLRSPMPSQVDRVVQHADMSLNTEPAVIAALSAAAHAAGRIHGIILMVELGDLREGILPGDLEPIALEVLRLPGLVLRGIGTNLACRSGVVPDARNMAELSSLADSIERVCGVVLDVVSGGNSANLGWALDGGDTGRIDDLRLGESILLGCDPLHRQPIAGLHTDAFTLVGEVIESKRKPARPWGEIAQTAFGPVTGSGAPRRNGCPQELEQAIVALGHQDTSPYGLHPPGGITILAASSDHLVLDSGPHPLEVGAELAFRPDYGALVRAMTSPFVSQVHAGSGRPLDTGPASQRPSALPPDTDGRANG